MVCQDKLRSLYSSKALDKESNLRLSFIFTVFATNLTFEWRLLMGIGMRELLVILLVVLIIFGGKRLPELGKGLGKALSNFRKAVTDKEDAEASKDSPSDQEPKA
jgi:sec-independent protein translocase protein TatA